MDITLIETQEYYGRVYEVFLPEKGESLILRINLPFEPRLKTLSEVETMKWVHENTNISVPNVAFYNASAANPVELRIIFSRPNSPANHYLRRSGKPCSFSC